MLEFNIITLFPKLFDPFLANLPLSRATGEGLVKVNVINLRDFAINKRGTVDGKPYGGGVGMLLRIEPIYQALASIYPDLYPNNNEELIDIRKLAKSVKKEAVQKKISVIALDPSGKVFTQKKAQELSCKKSVTFICGRYEGLDERIKTNLATEVISVGKYVLSGGELPALTIMESVTRLIPGVLEKEDATKIESFAQGKATEFPQYTKPRDFKGAEVPSVLLSGDHEKIKAWREENLRD